MSSTFKTQLWKCHFILGFILWFLQKLIVRHFRSTFAAYICYCKNKNHQSDLKLPSISTLHNGRQDVASIFSHRRTHICWCTWRIIDIPNHSQTSSDHHSAQLGRVARELEMLENGLSFPVDPNYWIDCSGTTAIQSDREWWLHSRITSDRLPAGNKRHKNQLFSSINWTWLFPSAMFSSQLKIPFERTKKKCQSTVDEYL